MKPFIPILLCIALVSNATENKLRKTATQIPADPGVTGHRVDAQTDGAMSLMRQTVYTNCVLWLEASYNNNSGTNYYDLSTEGNDGLQATAAAQPVHVSANGGTLRFDGINDQIIVAHDTSLDLTGTWTIASWIFHDTTAPGPYTYFFGKREVTYNWQLWVQQDDSKGRFFNPAGDGTKVSTGALNDNAWNHMAVAYDMTNLNFYFDGVFDSAVAKNANVSGLTHSLKIGLYGAAIAGATNDAFMAFSRCLSSNEIFEVLYDERKATYGL